MKKLIILMKKLIILNKMKGKLNAFRFSDKTFEIEYKFGLFEKKEGD